MHSSVSSLYKKPGLADAISITQDYELKDNFNSQLSSISPSPIKGRRGGSLASQEFDSILEGSDEEIDSSSRIS